MSATKRAGGANPPADVEYVSPPLPSGIAKALRMFKTHFPELLREHPGEWAACDKDQFLFVGKSWDVIYNRCLQRRLKEDEFVVLCLLPDATESID